MIGICEPEEELETIATVGGHEDTDAVLDAAIRALLRHPPEFRLALAIETYRGGISLNRAAERADAATKEFNTELSERGVRRPPGSLDADDRADTLESVEYPSMVIVTTTY